MVKTQNIELIIVPDVHGRTFWEDVFKYDSEIVFLGDYLDPYPSEGIYSWDALDNFTRILTFAKKNPKVHLLLGNHDLAYVKGPHICKNRIDNVNYDEISKLFVDHKDLFSLAYDCSINGRKFLLSHAGITSGWYEQHSNIFERSFTETLDAEYINHLYTEGMLNGVLGEVSSHRHGSSSYGSIVWAGIYEHEEDKSDLKTEVIQIVGHSQLIEYPLLIKRNYLIYDVDIRQCVYLDSQGELYCLKTGEQYVFV